MPVFEGIEEHTEEWVFDRGPGVVLLEVLLRDVRFVSCADEREEASFVASDLADVHAEQHVAYEGIAILYRINNQAKLFEEEKPYLLTCWAEAERRMKNGETCGQPS